MVALNGRSRILVAGVVLGLCGSLAGWPWAGQVAEAWAGKTPPPGWTAFVLAWVGIAGAALAAGALGADRRTLGSGALAGAIAAGLGSWIGLQGPLALWSQSAVWALAEGELRGRSALAIALADTMSWSALSSLAAGWGALLGGAVLGVAGAWLRGVSERASVPERAAPAWVLTPALLQLGAWSAGFVGLIAIHQVVPTLSGVPGADQVVDTDRLVLVSHAVLNGLTAGLLGFQITGLARRPQTGWRIAAGLLGVVVLLALASPWTHTVFAPSLGSLRQWPIYALGPFLGVAVGGALAAWVAPRWRQPTAVELLEEALLAGILLALLLAGPGLLVAGNALASGVAPLVPALESGLADPPRIDPLPAFAIAPKVVLTALGTSLLFAVLPGLPLRWLLGPARER